MTEKKLDMILNDCLNDAMCKVDRIKQPNSNKIAEFVTNWMKVKKLNIDDVSDCVFTYDDKLELRRLCKKVEYMPHTLKDMERVDELTRKKWAWEKSLG